MVITPITQPRASRPPRAPPRHRAKPRACPAARQAEKGAPPPSRARARKVGLEARQRDPSRGCERVGGRERGRPRAPWACGTAGRRASGGPRRRRRARGSTSRATRQALVALAASQDQPQDAGTEQPAEEQDADDSEIIVEGEYGPPDGDPMAAVNETSYQVSQQIDAVLVEPASTVYRDVFPDL